MYGWFIDLAGPTLGALLFGLTSIAGLILLFLAVYWLFGRAASSKLIAGGRNRKPRLAVIDVAAIDSRRRLVLIRRDDVEHLVMIGGPGDVVIEQGIRRKPPESRIAPEFSEPRPPAVEAPRASPVAVSPQPQPRAPEPVPPAPREPVLAAAPRVDPPLTAQTAAVRTEPKLEVPVPQPVQAGLDAELLRELEAGFAEKSEKKEPAKPEETLSSIFADIVRKHRGQ